MKLMNQKTRAAMLPTVIFALPVIAWAQVGIPCDGPDCTFDDLIILVNNIIQFLIFSVAVPLAAIGFMVMGAKMVIYSNKESAKTEAKEGIWLIIKGFLIMLAAFVVIKTVLYSLLSDSQVTFMDFMFQ